LFNDTNIQCFFETANFFKDIFKIFLKVLKMNKKKQQLTLHLCKRADSLRLIISCIYARLTQMLFRYQQ